MSAYVVLFLAILSRFYPILLHMPGVGFTAVGGSLLYFGARRSRLQCGIAVAALMITDFCLTTYSYHYAFHVQSYLVTWAWYAAICLFGHQILRRVTALRVATAVLTSATSFYLLSNFMVWLGQMYPHTAAGLAACYAAAIPFYRNDLISTTLVAGALFGLPALARRFATEDPLPNRAA